MKVYLVGGAVRDRLLGRPVTDRDYVVVGASPEALEALGYRRVGADFPVFLHPQTHCEYALARTERKSGKGYRGFVVHAAPDVTLEEDLARRDLTINAMAEDSEGRLIDPFGGAEDLRRRQLRHVGPAFVEDPLRVLRVARFAARLGFEVVPETLALMRDIAESGELETLAPERVWAEMVRALAEPSPAAFFQVLRDCNGLARLLPEIDALFGVPQPETHHPEIDTGVHSLMALTQAARLTASTEVRFAALTHDLGKAATPPSEWPRHHGHEAAGVSRVRSLCARLKAPRDHEALATLVARYHLHAHRAATLRPETLLEVLEAVDVFRRPERGEQFILACEADARGRLGFEDQAYPQADYWRECVSAARAISGARWASEGLPGPAIAAKIRALRLDAIAHLRSRGGPEETPA